MADIFDRAAKRYEEEDVFDRAAKRYEQQPALRPAPVTSLTPNIESEKEVNKRLNSQRISSAFDKDERTIYRNHDDIVKKATGIEKAIKAAARLTGVWSPFLPPFVEAQLRVITGTKVDAKDGFEGMAALTEGYKSVVRAVTQTAVTATQKYKQMPDATKYDMENPADRSQYAMDIMKARQAGAGMPDVSPIFKALSEINQLQPDQDYYQRLNEKGTFTRYLQNVVGMAPQMATQVAAYATTGGVGAGIWMAAQIAGLEYENLINQNVSKEKAAAAAWGSAAFQAPLEMLSLGIVLNNPLTRKFVSGGLARFGLNRLIGGGTEFLTETLQNVPSNLWAEWAKDPEFFNKVKTDDDYLSGLITKALDEGTAEGAVGAFYGALLGGAGNVGKTRIAKDEDEIDVVADNKEDGVIEHEEAEQDVDRGVVAVAGLGDKGDKIRFVHGTDRKAAESIIEKGIAKSGKFGEDFVSGFTDEGRSTFGDVDVIVEVDKTGPGISKGAVEHSGDMVRVWRNIKPEEIIDVVDRKTGESLLKEPEPTPVVEPEVTEEITPEPIGEETPIELTAKDYISEAQRQEVEEIQAEATRISEKRVEKRYKAEDKAALAASKKFAREVADQDPDIAVMTDIVDDGGIDRDSLMAALGETGGTEAAAALARRRPGLIIKGGKRKADDVAQENGYDTVDEMVQDWLARPTKRQVQERIAAEDYSLYESTIDEARDLDRAEVLADEEAKALRKLLKKTKPKWKDAKKYIKAHIERLGKLKVDKILSVKESEALKIKIKAEAAAARKAFAAGKREAALKHKERQRELLARRRAKLEVKRKILRLTKIIGRRIGKNIDFAYREAIEQIQAGVDLKGRSKVTLERRERTRQYLKNNKDAKIPKKLLAELSKRPLNDLSIDELEDMAAEVERLAKLGRKKRAAKIRQATKKRKAFVDKVVGVLRKEPPGPPPSTPIVAVPATSPASLWQKIRAWTLRPSRIADMIDRRAKFKGTFHKFFIDTVNAAENAKLVAGDKRIEAYEAKSKELGIKPTDLNKKSEFMGRDINNKERPMTREQLIGVYALSKNERGYNGLVLGNGFSPELIDKIIADLSKEEKALGDFMLQDFAENYDRVRQVFIDEFNEDMPYEENYFTMLRVGRDYKKTSEQIRDEILRRKYYQRGFPPKDFTKARKDLPAEYQKPLRLEAAQIWADQVGKQEHFIHFAGHVKQMHKALQEKELQDAISEEIGQPYNERLVHYADAVADPNIYRQMDDVNKGVQYMRQNIALAYLSANVVTAAKQLPSVLLYLGDAGPAQILNGVMQVMFNPIKTREFINARDPQVKHRSIEREIEELKKLNRSAYDRIVRRIGRHGLFLIRVMDRAAVNAGWMAVYNQNVEKHGEAEAIRRAQNATLRTQPAARAKDLAELYRSNEFLNLMTQFTNQLNQIWNITSYDIPSLWKNDEKMRAIMSSTGVALTALVIWTIVNQRVPEEPEEVWEAMQDELFAMLPFVGKHLQSASHGWKPSATSLTQAPYAVGLALSDAKPERKAQAAFEAASVTIGFPYVGVTRGYEFLKTGDPSKLLGKKPKKKKKR